MAHPVERRCWRRALLPTATAVALLLGAGSPSAGAQSSTCPQVTPAYTGPCGPTFVLPGWGDAGGWTNPEHYETIQLADVDGDGDDELLARTPAGIAIHDFDKTLGQWRPQVDSNDLPLILTEFANPPPLTTANPNPPATDWTRPQYYDTIQAADIDGQKGDEIVARAAAGLIAYKFTPGASPGQGSWRKLPVSDAFGDPYWGADPSNYATIQTGDLNGDGDAEVFGRQGDGIAVVNWNGNSGQPWTLLPKLSFLTDAGGGKAPAHYTSLRAANIDGDSRQELIGRDGTGVYAYKLRSGRWTLVNKRYQPFADQFELADCPFVRGDQTCFGSGPTYYGTIQFADVDGNGRAELLGRASDGLRVRRYQGDTPVAWGQLATLSDLSDANGWTPQKYWETIQFADINADGRAEALARGPQGLSAWSYDFGSKAWKQLTTSTALTLADDPWGNDRSYYSTIETGDVDGDKRTDVIARGPYGIRTWFFNRRGTGGWERYLPDGGYPDFPCAGDGSCQKAAFAMLNQQAQGSIPGGGTNLRDVWTGEAPPSQVNLTNLESLLTRIGNCTNVTRSNPTQYQTCSPPPGSSGFTAADWTTVLNQMFAEVFSAGQVWSHFYDSAVGVQANWDHLVADQLARLPTIRDDLALAGPADTSTEISPGEFGSTIFGLAGALIAAFPEASPVLVSVLAVAGDMAALIPSSTPELMTPFQSTYNDLQKTFADRLDDADDAISVHSQIVRRDPALLTLIGQLRSRGTWQLNPDAMRSVGRQGFALWIYKELLPVIWARYAITNCHPFPAGTPCSMPPSGAWFSGTADSFRLIAPAPTDSSPCPSFPGFTCNFVGPRTENANVLWGKLPVNCVYDGQNASTIWEFTCPLGVDPMATLADPNAVSATEGWALPTYNGSPFVHFEGGQAGRVTGIGSAGPARGDAVVQLRASIRLPQRLRLRRARVVFDRLLVEPRAAGELVRHRSGRRLPPLRLRRGGAAANVFASQRGRGPRVLLRIRRSGRGLASLRLTARNVAMPNAPSACNGTRPGVDVATEPITLHTQLRISDGRRRPVTISLKPQWQCRRDRLGSLRRLVLKPPASRAPTGRRPAIRLVGPRRLAPRARATYRITVRNRRRKTAHDVLITAGLPPGLSARRVRGTRVGEGQVIWRLAALRPGQSKTVRLRLRVGRSAARRACARVAASAIDTRAAGKRLCIRVAR